MTTTKNNRSLVLLLVPMLLNFCLQAQNLGVNATGATPNASSIIDLNTGNTFTSPNGKGLLPPNVALTSITDAVTVTSPAVSLLVYNSATVGTGSAAVVPGYYYWDGSKWVRLQTSAGAAQDWSLIGNAGTTAGTNFLGTTDAQDVVVKTNAIENMRILNTNGYVGIGTVAPVRKLHVYSAGNPGAIRNTVDGGFSGIEAYTYSGAGGTHPYFMGLTAKGTNTAATYPLSGDALSAFLGRDAIDGLVSANYGGADIYMLASENYSALNKGTSMRFSTTANGTNTVVERMRIDQNGNVGIGIATPAAKLHVADNQNKRTLHVEHNFNGLVNTDAAFIGGIDAGYSPTGLFVLQKDNVSLGSTGTNLINVVSNSVSKMLINGVGFMGIGTTSPLHSLHVHSPANNHHAITITAENQTDHWDIVKRGQTYAVGQNDQLVFAYNNIERVNFTSDGSIGVSVNVPLSRFDIMGVKPTAGAGTGVSSNAPSQAIIPAGSDGASVQNDWPNLWGGGTSTWDVCGTSCYMSAYITRSDRRLKKDILTMGSDITKTFMQLRPVTYLLKKEIPETEGLQYGFIAQEVAQLFPSIVTKDSGLEGGTIGMNYQALIAPTIYIVQQQQLQIQELTDKNNALQKQMAVIIALLKTTNAK